jgi:hypothetical protein
MISGTVVEFTLTVGRAPHNLNCFVRRGKFSLRRRVPAKFLLWRDPN